MKALISFVFFSLSLVSVSGQSYFWVGDGGNWSDLSHWATSSGGEVLHTTLPTAESDIFFDELSFTKTSQEVTLDQDSFLCRDLILEGVEFDPTFRFADYYDRIFIHGNLSIKSELTWSFIYNHMVGHERSTIHIEKAFMAGFLLLSPIDSSAQFELLADIEAQQIDLVNGRFDSKGYQMHVHEIRIGNSQQIGSVLFKFNDSEVRSSRFIARNPGDLDAGTSDITIFDGPGNSSVLFFGGGNDFHHVSFEGEIDRIKDNNSYVQFTAMPASNLSLEDGETQTAEKFVFDGTSSAPISLSSREEGEAAILEQKEGQVNGNYLILKDNSAIGGADFNAFNSIDNGNVSGWDIQVTASEDYYWIGNSGLWSDLNHWAKSSGGSDLHIELPSAIDNVYFDENSVSEADASIEVDLESILLNDLSMAGLMAGSEIKVNSGKFNIYGDVHFGANLILYFKEVEFASDSIQTLISNGSSWGFGSDLKFRGSGTVELGDAFHADEVSISSGSFNSNGQSITTIRRFQLTTLNDPVINLDNSSITAKSWIPSGPNVDVSLENTEISCSFIFYGEGFNYSKVNFTGRNWVYGPMFISDLEFSPGSEILILPGDTIIFNELTAIGSATDSIMIKSREEGERGFLHSESGEVNGSYLIIQDNHAIGGAIYNAENSNVDDQSVEGWNDISSSVGDMEHLAAHIFPNPAVDQFTVAIGMMQEQEIRIQDIYGRLMGVFALDNNQEYVQINCSDWLEGIYFVTSDSSKWSKKIAVSRNP